MPYNDHYFFSSTDNVTQLFNFFGPLDILFVVSIILRHIVQRILGHYESTHNLANSYLKSTCYKKCTYIIKSKPKQKMKAMNTPHLFTILTHCCHDACQGILHIQRVLVILYPLATIVDISLDFMITKPYTNCPITKKNQFHTWRKNNHLQT